LILFKKLRWKNLLSTGNTFTEVSLNTHNHTLIVGENGAGKSTILDALSFVLYGKPFRKVNKGQLINSINNKGLLVECEFGVGNKNYLVRRGSKPNVFEILMDGVMISQDAAATDYQEVLDKQILKLSHKTFSQVVVLGSASFIPFMQLAAQPRREVIEDLLDIQVFTTMNTLLKERISTNKSGLLDVDYMIKGMEDKIELEQSHLATLQQNTDELIKQKNSQINGYVKQVNDTNEQATKLLSEITTLSSSIEDQNKVRAKVEKLGALARQIRNRSDSIRKETEFFSANHDCPSCRQGIADEHRTRIIEESNNKLAEIEQGEQKIAEELDRYNTRLSTINGILVDISAKQTEAHTYQIKTSQLEQFVTTIRNELTQLTETRQFEVNNDRLKELKVAFKKLEQTKQDLINDKAVLDVAGLLLRDAGIKTKIIRQYVPVINKLINKYLASMDFFVNFELNENFEETIKSRFRDEFSYASFSEGEKSRIDLALLFTWRAIAKLRNSASTNLLILDEVFDGSLDAQGNEELLKILQTITEGSNVFVISHKTDAYLDKFERVLKFEKQKNFSRMVEL
jgi:DNA repair exonuclease SbcCD ATPase subunit